MGTWEEESSELFESRNEINKDISSNGTHTGEIDVEVVDGIGNDNVDGDGDESRDNDNGVVIEEGALVKQLESLEFRDNGSDGGKGDEEQLGEYNGANDGDDVEGKNEVYPLRPYAADCSFYIKAGTCKFGQNCRYNHPSKRDYQHVGDMDKGYGESNGLAGDAGKIECKYFQTPGGCKYGETCKYIHSASRVGKENVELNFLGLPIRPSAQECVFYLRNGSCGYGSNCRFNHPDPSAVNEFQSANPLENGKPVRGGINLPRNYSVESSPSFRGMSHGSSEPSNSMNTSYGPPYAPDRRSYHQTQVNTSSPANKFPRPHQVVNNFPKRVDPSTQYENPMQVEEFPERPGQPDCDYFMKTGNCKYRSACRYNHPSAQKSTLLPPPLSSKGLYSRPPPMLPAESSQHFNKNFNNMRKKGSFSDNHQNYQVQNGDFPERPEQPECEYYMKTGQCKFMSACRYHHPRNRVPTSSQCALSEKGLPLRSGAKLCRNYEQQGTCKYGHNCLYNHPDDYSPETPATTNSDTPYATNSDAPATYNVDSTWDDSWRM